MYTFDGAVSWLTSNTSFSCVVLYKYVPNGWCIVCIPTYLQPICTTPNDWWLLFHNRNTGVQDCRSRVGVRQILADQLTLYNYLNPGVGPDYVHHTILAPSGLSDLPTALNYSQAAWVSSHQNTCIDFWLELFIFCWPFETITLQTQSFVKFERAHE